MHVTKLLKLSWIKQKKSTTIEASLHKPGLWAYGQLLVLLVIRAMQHSADLLMRDMDEFKPIIININTGILKPDSFMKHQQLNKKQNLLDNCLYRLRLEVWIMVLSISRLVCDKDFLLIFSDSRMSGLRRKLRNNLLKK